MTRLSKRAPYLIVSLLVIAASWAGLFRPFDHAVMDLRLASNRFTPSQQLLLVQIDPHSLRSLPTWPWPRSYHARLAQTLLDAGAQTIVFDIDFSSYSTPAEDDLLATTFSRARGKVVLPVFKQLEGVQAGENKFAYNAPINEFLRHVRLAAANLSIEPDSSLRRYARIETWRNANFPTLAAHLAGSVSGPAFYIDFGLKPELLERASYADVLNGTFDPSKIAGRTVLVGTSAIELANVFPVPLHGVLPGQMVHAYAFETLIQGRAITQIPNAVILALSVALTIIGGPALARRTWRQGGVITASGSVLVIALSFLLQHRFHLATHTGPAVAALLLTYLAGIFGQFDTMARRLFRQGMALIQTGRTLGQLVDESFDGVLLSDHTGRIVRVNRSAAAILGQPADDILGQGIRAFFSETIWDTKPANGNPEDEWRARADNATTPVETTIFKPDGTQSYLEILHQVLALPPGKHPFERRRTARYFHTLTFRDITARKAAERARKVALDNAVAASNAKTEFINNISHELRTPLNAIIGFSELLDQQMLGPLGNERYREYVADILGSGRNLLLAVNNVLEVSNLDSGAYALNDEWLDILAILMELLDPILPRLEQRDITVEMALPADLPKLRGDRHFFANTMQNLLSNAEKFNHDGGTIAISAEPTEDHGIEICIRDTGSGMSAEAVANAVTPFYQADSTLARKFEGMGLGLYLVKRYLEELDGTFQLDSTPDAGTTATVRFPAARLDRVFTGDFNPSSTTEPRAQRNTG